MGKRVSVVMATFNGERFLNNQILTVLKQLSVDDELIITDDKSVDNSIEIIKSFNDSRIKLITSDINIGLIKNFEKGLMVAKGEYIFLCDQDDIWREDKVSVSIEYLKTFDLIVSDCKVIDEDSNLIYESYFLKRRSGSGLVKNILANTYLGCCIAFRSSLVNIILPFPKRIPMHDIWIGLIVGLFYRPVFVEETLVFYRQHRMNVSPTAIGISNYSFLEKIRFRLNLLRYVPLAVIRKYMK